MLIGISSLPVQAQIFESESDNFKVELPEVLYPVILSYEQESRVGTLRIKSVSFHSSLGKFLVEIADYPSTDQRPASSRIDAKIAQLRSNPDRQLEQLEHFLSESTPGAMIKSFDRGRSEIHALFVSGQREYHISSESFTPEDLDEVLVQTETIVRSFEITETN